MHTHTHTVLVGGYIYAHIFTLTHTDVGCREHGSGRTVWGRLRRERGFRSNHPSCPPPPLSRFLSLLQSFTGAWWCWCSHPSLFLSPTLFLSFFSCIFFSLDMVPWTASDKGWRQASGVVDFFFLSFFWMGSFSSTWRDFFWSILGNWRSSVFWTFI